MWVYAVYQPPAYFAGVYSPQLPYMNRVYAGYTLSPSKKAKYVSYNTKINTITSQQMVFFQARNALKTVFSWGFAPDPTGEVTMLPRPPSRLGRGAPTPHFPSAARSSLGLCLRHLVQCIPASIFSNTPLGKPFWILLEQEMMRWQWHQLDHMQIICTSIQTDNHASTTPLSFYRLDTLPATQPTVSKH